MSAVRGGKPVKRASAKRMPTKRAPARTRLAANAAPLAVVPAFASQRSHASLKQQVLFDLERGRVAVHAAIQGMTGGHADTPIAPGKWSPRQLVLHLAFWDRFVLNAIPFALHQNECPNYDDMDLDAINAQGLLLYGEADWDEARRILDRTREELRMALAQIPPEPAHVWTREHALGKLVSGYEDHDRHHAAQIKTFRMARASA